jgi:hypothetical protein
MAGFQLTLYGRIWVTPKGNTCVRAFSKGHHGRVLLLYRLAFFDVAW